MIIMVVAALGVMLWSAVVSTKPISDSDQEMCAGFDELQDYIAGLAGEVLSKGHRTSLGKKLDNAEMACSRGKICTAVNILGAYLNQTQALRRGEQVSIAEDLHNKGYVLRNELLARLPGRKICPGHERYGVVPVVEVAESDNKHLAGSFAFGQSNMWSVQADGELFTQVVIPGVDPIIGEPGLPGIPVVRRLVAVPRGAEVTIDVSNPTVAETLNLNLFPFQNQAVDQDVPPEAPPETFADPPFVKDEQAYMSDAWFPEQICSVMLLGQFRDLPIAQVSCAAGRYNPQSDTLELYDSVKFDVNFTGDGNTGAFVTDKSLSPFESETGVYAGAVLNEEEVFEYTDTTPEPPVPQCFGEELIIITYKDFRPAADKLAKWKRNKGIVTSVFDVDSTTTAEDIDNYIEQRYDDCLVRPSYVLLLGDADYIPTFYVSTFLSNHTGTDYLYASYPDPSFPFDIFPDFGVGRIPVDTLQEGNVVVDKIVSYESNPPNDVNFYRNISIASQFQCCRWDIQFAQVPTKGWDQRGFIETSELVRDELVDEGYTVERIYTETEDPIYTASQNDTLPRRYYDGTPLPTDIGPNGTFLWDGSTLDIIDAFNNGRFLILHRDHGSWIRWSNPEFTRDHVSNNLTNGNRLPVVFSINCSSGLFDNETNPGGEKYPTASDETYFAERLLRMSGGGAIGIIGDTRDSPTWTNNSLTRGLFDAIWPDIAPSFGDSKSKRRLGDILNHAKMYLFSQDGIPETTETLWAIEVLSELALWHIIGDPTLEIWTSPHFLLSADYTADFLGNSLRVRYAVDGATITALQVLDNGDTVPIGRATVKGGTASLEFVEPPQPGVAIQLSASMENAVSVLLTPEGEQLIDLPDESAFSNSAIRISFDPEEGRSLNEHISNQYSGLGVLFVDDETTTPLIIDDNIRVGFTKSEPYSLSNDADTLEPGSAGVPLTMVFTAPIQRVGMYIGNGAVGTIIEATLTAYDEDGTAIMSVVRSGFSNDVKTFIGLDAGVASIRQVRLGYGNTSLSEEIDDLLFE